MPVRLLYSFCTLIATACCFTGLAQPNIVQQLADVCPGICSGSPSSFTSFQGKLYFLANHPTAGREMHVFNGTSVSLVEDLEPGPADGFSRNHPIGHTFTEMGGKLYFAAAPSTTFFNLPGTLWSYDGVNPMQQIIVDLVDSFAIGVSYVQMLAVKNKLYFGAGSITNDAKLCTYDASTNDTTLIPTSPFAGSAPVNPRFLCALDSSVFFAGSMQFGGGGPFLYRYDPVPGEVTRLVNTEGFTNPRRMLEHGGYVYFAANGTSVGNELYRANRTGTIERLSNFPIAAAVDQFFGTGPRTLASHGADIYLSYGSFGAGDSARELFRYSPALDTITKVSEIAAPGSGGTTDLYSADGRLFMQGFNSTTGSEVYAYNGTSLTPVHDFIPGSSGFSPQDFRYHNGYLYFTGFTATDSTELYRMQGITPAGMMNPTNGPATLSLSPNPTTALLTIALPAQEVYTAAILSPTGQLIHSEAITPSSNAISVETLPAGLYFLRLTNAATGLLAGTARFVKQ